METTINREFMRNLVRSFPDDQYALRQLISIATIKLEPSVPTCCIMNVGRPVILLGTDFYKEKVDTYEKLAFLIHHEVMHKIMGHLSDSILETMMQYDVRNPWYLNLIQDLVIQGIAYQVMPQPHYQALNKECYGDAKWPASLLYHGNQHDTFIANRIMRLIYSPIGITYDKLVELLLLFENAEKPMCMNGESDGNGAGGSGGDSDDGKSEGEQEDGDGGSADNDTDPDKDGDKGFDLSILLGSHGDDAEDPMHNVADIMREISEETEDALGDREAAIQNEVNRQREILIAAGIPFERIEMELDAAKKGWGLGGSPYRDQLKLGQAHFRKGAELERKLTTAVDMDEFSKLRGAVQSMVNPASRILPLPNVRNKRFIAMLAMDEWNIFNRVKIPGSGGKVHMYVDVSGSQGSVYHYTLRLMRDCAKIIDPRINVFSTVIDTLQISDFRLDAMKFKNTGGTDFHCIIRHAVENKFKKIVVLTDGYSEVKDKYMERARKHGLQVLVGFTEKSGYKRNTWKELTISEFELPIIKGADVI